VETKVGETRVAETKGGREKRRRRKKKEKRRKKAVKSEEEVKKLLLENFHKWIYIFGKKVSKRMPMKKV